MIMLHTLSMLWLILIRWWRIGQQWPIYCYLVKVWLYIIYCLLNWLYYYFLEQWNFSRLKIIFKNYFSADRFDGELIEVLVCSVRQSATGEPPVGRSHQMRKTSVAVKEHRNINEDKTRLSEVLIPQLPLLLHRVLFLHIEILKYNNEWILYNNIKYLINLGCLFSFFNHLKLCYSFIR